MIGEIIMIVTTLAIVSTAFSADLAINMRFGETLKGFILALILYFVTATFIWFIWFN